MPKAHFPFPSTHQRLLARLPSETPNCLSERAGTSPTEVQAGPHRPLESPQKEVWHWPRTVNLCVCEPLELGSRDSNTPPPSPSEDTLLAVSQLPGPSREGACYLLVVKLIGEEKQECRVPIDYVWSDTRSCPTCPDLLRVFLALKRNVSGAFEILLPRVSSAWLK